MKSLSKVLAIVMVLGLMLGFVPMGSASAETIVPVYVLEPSWTAVGGGGVYSTYIGPTAYAYVSPGLTAVYDGLEAGIIKAGLAVDPVSGHFEDEGLFGFIPNVTIDTLAARTLSYDMNTEAGINSVWMTIEIDTGVVGDRNDNTTYQHVPTTNPAGWHTVNAAAGLWQKWNNDEGDVSGNPLIALADIAAANTGLNVVRAYLRLGMGDSYNNGGTGTIAWIDKVSLADVTYDFQVNHTWYVATTGSDTNSGTTPTNPFLSIQHAHDIAVAGDTIILADGTYTYVTEGITLPIPPAEPYQGLINIYKQLIIKAADDGNVVRPVIDASSVDGVFKLHANALTGGQIVLEGLELTGDKPTTGTAITLMYCGETPPTEVIIRDNAIHGMIGGINAWASDSWCSAGTDYKIYGIQITDNEFYDLGVTGIARGFAIALESVSDWTEAGNAYSATVSGNSFQNIYTKSAALTDLGVGIAFVGGAANAEVFDNTFSGDISVDIAMQGADVATTNIYNNDLSGGVYGVAAVSTTGGSTDASPNWWGTTVYSAIQPKVMGSVTYIPWCTDVTCTEVAGPVHNVTQDTWFGTIQDAVSAAANGETIQVNGTYTLTGKVTINKDLTLTCDPAAVIQVSGTGTKIEMAAVGSSLVSCSIQSTDKANDQIFVDIMASNVTIQDNTMWGNWNVGDLEVSRAMRFYAGAFSGILIDGNEIHNLRQPGYISGTHTGMISNNYVHSTKGWVLEGGNLTFEDNTWSGNVGDIAILAMVPASYYTDIVAMSLANNNAVIEDQRLSTPLLSVVYVDDSAAPGGNGTQALPLQTIQAGINRVISGGTIYVAAGTYVENPATTTTMNKSINLIGEKDLDGDPLPVLQGTLTLNNSLMVESNLVENFVFQLVGTGNSVSLTQINGITFRNVDFLGTGSIAGVGISMTGGANGTDNVVIDDCSFTNGYYVAVQGSVKDITVTDSVFSGIKSGINLQSGQSNLVVDKSSFSVVAQSATNDTYGIRLGSAAPADSGKQLAVTNSSFVVDKNGFVADSATFHAAIIVRAGVNGVTSTVNNSTIVGEVVNQSAVTLDATQNWWGSADGPAAGQVVGNVAFCGWLDAAPPDGEPVAKPVVNTTRGTSFCSIQAAIDDVATVSGDVITVEAGTYTDPILVNKSVTLLGPNALINPNTEPRVPEAVLKGTTTSGLSQFVNIDAENVVIKGFTFDNLRIDNYWSSTHEPIIGDVVENNIFTNVAGTAIYLRDGRDAPGLYSTGVNVSNNKIDATTSAGSVDYNAGTGIIVFGAESSSISDNVIFSAAYNGIQLARCNQMTVSGNIATSAAQPALQIAQWNDGTFTISGNTFSTISTTKAAVRLYGFTNSFYPLFNFTGNTIQDSNYAFQIGHGDAGKGYNDIRDADYSFNGNTFTNVSSHRLIIYLANEATLDEKAEMDALFAQLFGAGNTAAAITSADPFTYVVAACTTYCYVATTGDDMNPGTESAPLLTIQKGIDNVTTGGIVHVAPGLYDERVNVNKPLTLLGATHGVSKKGYTPPAGYAYDLNVESVIMPSADLDVSVLTINADQVTVDGFVIANTSILTAGNMKNLVQFPQSMDLPIGSSLINSVIGPLTGPAQDGNLGRFGVVAPGPSTTGATKTRVITIADNYIYDCLGNGGGIAIIGAMDTGTEINTGTQIINNTITGHHRSGIEIAGMISGTETTPVLIAYNNITNNGGQLPTDAAPLKYGNGIAFIRIGSDRTSGEPYGIPQYVKIFENVITGNEKNGIYLGPLVKDLTIEGNTIQDNGEKVGFGTWDGIHIDLNELYYAAPNPLITNVFDNVIINGNNLISNGSHEVNLLGGTPDSGSVDASENWWGAATGPIVGQIAGAFATCGWLDDVYPDGDPVAKPVNNITSGEGFCTIQAAIDAASAGDTITVAAGTYVEQVTITKDITLRGAGKDVTTIQAFSSMPICFTTSKDHRPVVCVKDANATIDGFSIDGLGLGNTNVNFEGVAFRNAGGTLQNSIIKDIRDTPFSGAQHGVAVYLYNDDTTARTIHVLDNVIIGFQKNAMALNASATNPLTVDIRRNVITGAGSTAITAQNGIQVDTAAGGGVVANNTITGITYDGSSWVATSILIYNSQDLDTTGNTISDAHMGIYYIGASGLINGNTLSIIEGAGAASGIYTDGGDVVISDNTLTFQTTPFSGSLGIGVDAGWDDNDVDANVHDNNISGFDWGLVFTQCSSGCGTGGFTSISAVHNTLYGNTNAMYVGGPLTISPYIFHNKLSDGTNFGLYNDLSGTLTAEANWWGSMFGPAAELYAGDIDFNKWCGDEECTKLLPDDSNTITIGPGLVNIPGGINAYVPGITYLVLDGTTIQNTGEACFNVYANNTLIKAESKLGAVCVPAAGKNGVNVAVNLQTVEIVNLEFDGSAGGVTGVNIPGVVDYLNILDNWFHDFTGNAVEFQDQPTGVIAIQGNLFQDNDGYGIQSYGLSIPAEYNSWGHVDGPALGDGASSGVDADPWTHVDLYLTSPDTATIGGYVTYTVYGNLTNVMGAGFTLAYPTGSLELDPTSLTNLSGFVEVDDGVSVFDITTAGEIRFNGTVPTATAITNKDMPIYSVKFKVLADGGLLDLDDTDYDFPMAPETTDPFNPALSTNIYPTRFIDSLVTTTAYTVQGTFYMEYRGTTRQGIPGTLTGATYGLHKATSTNLIPNNLKFLKVAAGNYTFTTLQPRYLNITTGLAKTVAVTADVTFSTPLTLIAGNAIWTDNAIDILDAGFVGGEYGRVVADDGDTDADVDYSGKVGLADLGIVGKNYGKSSEVDYSSWTPVVVVTP